MKQKDNQKSNYKTQDYHMKQMTEQYEPLWKPEVKSGAPEG